MHDRRSLLHLPFNILRTTLIVGSSGLAIFAVVVFFNLWQVGWQAIQSMGQWLKITETEPQVDVSTLVVQQIRGVSELTTTIFAMEAIVPTSQDRQWGNLVVGRSSLLYVAYGEVRAGIDLSEIKPENVRQQGDRLIVQLPAPEILDKKIDVGRSQVYDYDRGFLNLGPDTAPELQTLAQRQTLDKIVISACDQGILQLANERAEVALTRLLNNAGHDQVDIETTSPKVCAQVP